jgi:hypothetical protein
MIRLSFLILLLAVACGSNRPKAPEKPELFHKTCPGEGCGTGLACLTWQECSIPASGSGSKTCVDHQTCELECKGDSDCPDKYSCVANNAPVDQQKKICDNS